MDASIDLLKLLIQKLDAYEVDRVATMLATRKRTLLVENRLNENIVPLVTRIQAVVAAERIKPEAKRRKTFTLPLCDGEPVQIELGVLERLGGYGRLCPELSRVTGCKIEYVALKRFNRGRMADFSTIEVQITL